MRILRMLVAATVLAAMATLAAAEKPETPEMPFYTPKDAKGVIETVNAAELRTTLLDSAFWKGLEQTAGFKEWRASERYAEMRQRLDKFLATIEMSEGEVMKAYLGGRTAVVFLPSGAAKPWGVILTETTPKLAQRLVAACGGSESTKYRGITIYTVEKDNRTDRMAYTNGLLIVSDSSGNQIEQILDVVVGGGPKLASDGTFTSAADGLPTGWRVRAFGAQSPPRKGPGAIALYPKDKGRVHFEWNLVGGDSHYAMTAPVALQGPRILPANSVAAVSTALHLPALWSFAKEKLGAEGEKGQQKVRQIDMFWRGMFTGQTMDAITAGFGPEAAAAILKADGAGTAPGAVVAVRLAENGKALADNFKASLSGKVMLITAFTADNPNAPKINVKEEAYGDASLLIIEAPGLLEKFLGDWAKDAAVTVAVTKEWLIVGTTPSGVKRTIDTMAGKGQSLAAVLKEAGETVPTQPATRWGVILPQGVSDILTGFAEKLAGQQGADKIKKLTNLSEAVKLLKYIGFCRTDTEAAIHGQADVQAIQ